MEQALQEAETQNEQLIAAFEQLQQQQAQAPPEPEEEEEDPEEFPEQADDMSGIEDN